MAKIEEKAEELLKKQINELGYELYDIEYIKEGKDFFLRIYIDNKEGINLDDCEKVNNAVNEILDKEDYIKEKYFLEVSSPGIERVLRKDIHLQSSIGKDIQVKLFKNQEESKEHIGVLKSFDNDFIIIQCESREIKIERKNIAQIKTVYKW